MQGIVICHHPANKLFLDDLLKSIKTDYPVFVCVDGKDRPESSYELGAIAAASKKFDEFVFLQDTCVIKDNALFERLFSLPGNVALTSGFYHYMGKYADLREIPSASSKEQSILLETRWMRGRHGVFDPELPVHTDIFEDRHGRKNMKLENPYIIKWKGTWSI